MHVVATAGHVDHGKSTLVTALTGIDPDRLAEEKARGLTIDLGFAWATLPSGRDVGFVDVPGHVRFLRNMLAGVGAVDACLFVVAATEGWKPQSEEHLRILELLGVRHGLVALTKVSLVGEDDAELARLAVEERVAGTFLDGAPVVAVDAPGGRGLSELVAALDRVLARTPTAVDRGRPRLWIDRSFAVKGSGTVVTGTLTGGTTSVGDGLTVEPQGLAVRVRTLQTHGAVLDEAGPGRRLAVNLAGVAHTAVRRGGALVRADQWFRARRVDASLHVLPSLEHDVGRRGAYRAYIGSGEHPVAVRILGGSTIPPGATGHVRLHLPVALPLLPGDRFILRESGRGETVGGGQILDVDPVLPASRARPDRRVERVVEERGWIDVDLLERLTGQRVEPTVGRWVVAPAVFEATRERLLTRVAAGVDLASLDDREREVVATLEGVRIVDGRARLAGGPPVGGADRGGAQVGGGGGHGGDALATHPFVRALEAAPFTPVSAVEAGVDRGELRRLVHAGHVVERDGMHFAASAVALAAEAVARLLRDTPGGVTASQVREALGTTRKYVLPLLGHLDATGVTRRRGDLRIAGPRLPSVDDEPDRPHHVQ